MMRIVSKTRPYVRVEVKEMRAALGGRGNTSSTRSQVDLDMTGP